MYDIQKIEINNGDVIVFEVDIEKCDLKHISDLINEYQKCLPLNRVIAIPKGVVTGINILSSQYFDYERFNETVDTYDCLNICNNKRNERL